LTVATLAVVDATSAVPNRGVLVITATIQKDAAALDVTAKTVTATIRREEAPGTVVNAALEDHGVSLITAASGIVALTLSNAEMSYMDVPMDVTQAYPYIVQFYVVDDNYGPQPYRLPVYGVIN
jgi:hypothetical protein